MKKNIAILTTILAVCLISISASAQNKVKLELDYNVSIPTGGFKSDYVNKTSFRGATGELSYTFSPSFSLGLQSGYQNYYQKYDRAVYKINGDQTVSAVLTNSMNVTPLILRGTWYPTAKTQGKIQPYLSGGAGVNLVDYGQYLGEFGGTETKGAFAAQVGAGLKIPFGNSYNQTAFKLGADYNYCNYNRNEITNINTIGLHAGVVFGLK